MTALIPRHRYRQLGSDPTLSPSLVSSYPRGAWDWRGGEGRNQQGCFLSRVDCRALRSCHSKLWLPFRNSQSAPGTSEAIIIPLAPALFSNTSEGSRPTDLQNAFPESPSPVVQGSLVNHLHPSHLVGSGEGWLALSPWRWGSSFLSLTQ